MGSSKRWALKKASVLVLMCAVAAQALGCAGPPPLAPPPRVVGAVADYVIGVTDLLEIKVWRQPELSAEVVVRRDGKISMSLVDDLQAEGLTALGLKKVVTDALSEFINSPQVSIVIKAMNSNVASVIGGGVARSGIIPLQRNTRVLDAIASMGGFTTFAQKDDVRILREDESGRQIEYGFDYNAFIKGKAPDSNMLLEPGDTVVVPD
jgi:polysaccharide export outer membrane protein